MFKKWYEDAPKKEYIDTSQKNWYEDAPKKEYVDTCFTNIYVEPGTAGRDVNTFFFSSMWAPIVENKYMFGEIIGLSICCKFHLFEKFLTTCSELIQAMVTYWGFDLLGETQTNFNRSKIQRRNIFFQANVTGMSTS